jgi:hypothetical protein
MGYDRLIVVTAKPCYIYNTSSFATPGIFDPCRGTVNLILLAERYHSFVCSFIHSWCRCCYHYNSHFMLVDSVDGMQIFSYDEHKLLSNPRAPGVNPGNIT